jgi:hypothetical protein
VTVAREKHKLKLGKGAAFVKGHLKALRQEDDVWEVDFRALPKPIMQTETHYLGMVVTQPDGFLLADLPVEYTPDANDLATLLVHAMRRPLTEGAHRPRRILVRKNPVVLPRVARHRRWRLLLATILLERVRIGNRSRRASRKRDSSYQPDQATVRQDREGRGIPSAVHTASGVPT